MNEVEEYCFRYEGEQRLLLIYFHELLAKQFKLKPKLSYGIPMYAHLSNVVYLNPLKSGGVDLCFMDGQQLQSEPDLLDDTDRKRVAGIAFQAIAEVPENRIRNLITEAIKLNERLRSKKKA